MRPALLIATLLPGLALAEGAAVTDKPEKDELGNRWVFRGGANLDLNQSINLGGTSGGARINAGLNGGVGYLLTRSLEADLDAHLSAYLNPLGLDSVEFIPGVRWRPVDNLQVHVGVPIPLYPQVGLGVLGGLAYLQPLGDHATLAVGFDYTYYLTEYYRSAAPLGRLDVHGGIQTHF